MTWLGNWGAECGHGGMLTRMPREERAVMGRMVFGIERMQMRANEMAGVLGAIRCGAFQCTN